MAIMVLLGLFAASRMQAASAHEHHELGDIDMGEPIDAMLWIHITVQLLTWGISFPTGMILGLSKSRYHVPLQSVNILLTLLGIVLGHKHGGRQFPATAHGILAKIIFWVMLVQAGLGGYLRAHLTTLRPKLQLAHRILGVTFPILGWTQLLLGFITLLSYCFDGALGQCLAHYIMGSAFIGYAVVMVVMMTLGQTWLERTGKSQEYLDSWVICVWGVVNTFSEHHDAWNKNWSHKDMQHTMMGVLWWTGGALGIFLSRNGKRSFVPAVIIIMTGWGMSAHEQALMISSKIHALFGYALMAAGLVRIIEVCFVLNDKPAPEGPIRIIQYIPPYLLTLGGTTFMSATDEEMHRADDLGIDHVTYGLFVFSLSFLIFLNILFLTNLYSATGVNARSSTEQLTAKEEGYTALAASRASEAGPDGPGEYELTEQDVEGQEHGERDSESPPHQATAKDDVGWLNESRSRPWMDRSFG